MSGPFGSSQWMYATGAVEGQSLRFNDDDSAYLSRTPSTTGNRKTWTFSVWVKRGNLSSSAVFNLIMARTGGGTPYTYVDFSTDQIRIGDSISGGLLETNAVFRDPSSWYHIVASVDTTNATAGDRFRLYVNGVEETSLNQYITPTLNSDTAMNSTVDHQIGMNASGQFFDGYLAEVNFVDGTALDPTSFGETNANGQWVPITSPSVTYGTNGFYLPFTNDYEVEGFNTVTYKGTGADQYIGGVGFEPDFVWIKSRSTTYDNQVYDSVRGVTKRVFPNKTDAELTGSDLVQSFDTDGFTVGTNVGLNSSSHTYVAWAWDMGTGSAASNTDGSITSSVKASQTYGQSIVSFTSTGSAGTVGHGLSQAPELIIAKQRPVSSAWAVYSPEIGATKRLQLQTNDASATDSSWNNTAPTSTVFSQNLTGTSGRNIICYCFHSVAGYSSFGSYAGNGSSTGPTVTTGFKPAFVMIKRTDYAGGWIMFDNTRTPYNPLDKYLRADSYAAEVTASAYKIDFNSNGFQLKGTGNDINQSGGTYIYMAFADKREAAFWLDQSGNNNDWTNNNMQESDISLDSPTNNFCTYNPTDPHGGNASTLSEGNLKASSEGSNSWSRSTYWIESGAYYIEILSQASGGQHSVQGNYDSYFSWTNSGAISFNGASVGTYSTHTSGDIIGLAIDRDANTVKFYKNNTLVYTGTSMSGGAIKVGSFLATSAGSAIANFGQDSSFAGNKVAQGNTDENGFGDFYYEPPAGYLALCTSNLPDPAINDGSDHFNTVLYTGNGSTQSVTGVGFQPSLTWVKDRTSANSHWLNDEVRGAGLSLASNTNEEEKSYAAYFTSFDSDGFSFAGGTGGFNATGDNYAAWNWKAGGTSGTTNTDGSITSTVSANQTAGFSIVSWTGTGTSGTDSIGHGLSSAPELVITKNRDVADFWPVFAPSLGTGRLKLDATDAYSGSGWFTTMDSNTINGIYGSGTYVSLNASGEDYIAYCFHGVEGYSKFGSYTGNGSTDGPFVYTGFRPAFLIIKRTSGTGSWHMYDNKRDTINVVGNELFPNLSNAESTGNADLDLLSNGFKARRSATNFNASGSTYIYMAFAENPFKYSNAR